MLENNLSFSSELSKRDLSILQRALDVLEENKYDEVSQYFDGKTMISPGKNNFKGIWNWDSAFHAIGVSHFDKTLAEAQIEGFLDQILPDGMLPDLIDRLGNKHIHSSKPPVFAWASFEVYKNTGDVDFLARIYDKLSLNEAFWRTNRFDGYLFHYGSYLKGSDEENLTWAKWESGWDNSVRWDRGIEEYYPVDLNCFMLSFYRCMGEISILLGKSSDLWAEKAEDLQQKIEEALWNEKIGAYTDKNRFTNEFSDVLTPASFMPLFVQAASFERAQRMAEIAEDPKKFNATMPTVSYDDPEFSQEYWRGPLWLNTAYFAAKGLKNYAFPVADRIKENILSMINEIEDGIYENYDTVNVKGLYCRKFSWSACFAIEFILNW